MLQPVGKSQPVNKDREIVKEKPKKPYIKNDRDFLKDIEDAKKRLKIESFYRRYFKESTLQGEYWIQNGSVTYADGDIGDFNHDAIVLQSVISDIADLVGVDLDEYDGESELYEKFGETLEDSELKQRWEDGEWQEVMEDCVKVEHPEKFEDFRKLMNVLNGNSDIREFGKSYYGWIRVRSNNVDAYNLNNETLKSIADGLYEAFGEDALSASFNLEFNNPRKFYTDVPFADISTVPKLNRHRLT